MKELFALGLEIAPKATTQAAYGRNVIQAEAERRKLKPETIRRARQLADPVDGYTAEELRELCRHIAQIHPGQDDDLAVFTCSHLVRLLSIRPKSRRIVLQQKVIEQGWSTARLEAEIAARYGTRRAGGKRRRIPRDVVGLLIQIEAMTESWRRWMGLVRQEGNGNGQRQAVLADLPAEIQRRVHSVANALIRLQDAVIADLSVRKPGRDVRPQLRDNS